MGKVFVFLSLFLLFSGRGATQDAASPHIPAEFKITAPRLILAGVDFKLEAQAVDAGGNQLKDFNRPVRIFGINSAFGTRAASFEASFENGRLELNGVRIAESGCRIIRLTADSVSSQVEVRVIPGILSILPPLFAIVLALVARQVVISLAAGIWLGAVFLFDYDLLGGIFRVLDHFVLRALSDTSHVQIILFSMLFGGMVGVITQNGGTRGIANLITRYAGTARGGQLATWGMALILFFDDYANVLVRGNLMRPITDKLSISREKLSYIVDTGAATVASIFIISTWIGYEVGLIDQGLLMIQSSEDAYSVFLRTIPYRFYPILALIFAFLVAVSNRDFGPMADAELRARREGKVLREGSQPATDLTESTGAGEDRSPPRWYNGILPILTILVVGLSGLYLTGTRSLAAQKISDYRLGDIVSNADSYAALLWASLAGCVVAILLSLIQRIQTLNEAMDSWFNGLKSMLLAMLILVLAWSIGSVTEELHTADYLVQILRGSVSPFLLPVLTFLIAASMSFATGTSWGTMAIMMPIVIPLANTLGLDEHLSVDALQTVLLGVISSVLAGAVFGDHCSPISDTTILSSMSSACDHIDHVRTQLPYALVVAIVGMLVGDIPTAYGLSPWISIILGTAIMTGILFLIGRKVETPQ